MIQIIFLILAIILLIAVAKGVLKHYGSDLVKNACISVIVISILNLFHLNMLYMTSPVGYDIFHYLGVIRINISLLNGIMNFSMLIAALALVKYLYTEK